MMKAYVYLVVIFFLTSIDFSHGQPIINYNWNDHGFSLVGSFTFWSASHLVGKFTQPEVLDDFHDVDQETLWKLDLRSLKQTSLKADRLSDATLYLSGMMPIALALSQRRRQSNVVGLSLLAVHGFLLESGFTHFVKLLAERPRPHIYLQGPLALNKPISKNSTKSFYSGHTSSSAYFTFFTAQVFSMMYPHSQFRKYVWTVALALPAITGYLRVKAGKHFPTDVMVGYLVGGSIGLLLPKAYSKHKDNNVQLYSTGNGIALRLKL